ncbi:hypothetical protein BOTBODRAFT_30150 [Botryobasidium botryosum FD-172 SS1]|uniref:Isomerase YbhE n=1 Tax=Botryobasidium botryosum (strain FD-172 SS1) TaxID=930990 RepID=A0A067MRN0_BOTB1|nr:hypothetical protein BOTBODRAFT_30150 [Botryobasidium botryosum FD-172 SS1]
MVNLTILAGSYTTFIRALSFNADANSLSLLSQSPAGSNPSWIALNPLNHSVLYATNENSPGGLLSFSVTASGTLTQIDSFDSGGDDPAYLLPLNNGKEVAIMNFSSSNGSVMTLTSDFSKFTSSSPVVFVGSGPNADSQDRSHPHEVVEVGNELFVPDLGADKIWRLGRSASGFQTTGFIQQAAGSGPRHIAVKDNTVFAVHELDNTLTSQTIPPLNSATPATLLANLTTLPPDIPTGSTNGAAELILSSVTEKYPQQFLYASNRNVSPDPRLIDPRGDTIAIFSPEPLQLVKHVYTGLNQIRGMALGGVNQEYLIAAGLTGGGVAIFQRTNNGTDLQLLARFNGTGSDQISSFAFL